MAVLRVYPVGWIQYPSGALRAEYGPFLAFSGQMWLLYAKGADHTARPNCKVQL